jgi:hypothetical protein
MYVVVQHEILEPSTAFARGQRMIDGQGAPEESRVLQFYPSQDSTRVTCLWESASVDDVQGYVDATLGDASRNLCYEVDSAQGFAERPLGLQGAPATAR